MYDGGSTIVLIIATLAINYWDRLMKFNWVYNGIHGVNASVVGLLCLTFFDIQLWLDIRTIVILNIEPFVILHARCRRK